MKQRFVYSVLFLDSLDIAPTLMMSTLTYERATEFFDRQIYELEEKGYILNKDNSRGRYLEVLLDNPETGREVSMILTFAVLQK